MDQLRSIEATSEGVASPPPRISVAMRCSMAVVSVAGNVPRGMLAAAFAVMLV